jgi:hypothetical protein
MPFAVNVVAYLSLPPSLPRRSPLIGVNFSGLEQFVFPEEFDNGYFQNGYYKGGSREGLLIGGQLV